MRSDLRYVKEPKAIVDRGLRRLRNKTIRLVKIQWSDDVNDVTWESKDKIRTLYPMLIVVSPEG